ncbi:hypothetical protein [Treponema berlinense]|uniref:hypothetical protein n=1 Tax=Treponema berlinense TaxID=225004 RepID=UPI003FD74BFA
MVIQRKKYLDMLVEGNGNGLVKIVTGIRRNGKSFLLFNIFYFIQQNSSICKFNSSDSWVILSPLEQSIKSKIEQVGTPLKEWDISINYGIKTGFNDAFIISGEKRQEILNNCSDVQEKARTDEIIRLNFFICLTKRNLA